MFVKLAFKNIQRSIKDYAIYFFTLALGVAIFYVFNSLESQAVMLDVNERVRSMLELINVIMGTVSIFVSFILGALIIYASRFLIKRRSKEFGIYLTLGMGKRKISLILILETFFIGLLSLAAGLALGVVLSQFTSVLVANMFDADLTHFQFVFSLSAFLKTLLYFGIIYIVVMFFNTIVVSRQKLINLLSSSSRNEKIKNKNLWLCVIVFIVAAAVLGYAYYLVTAGLEKLMFNSDGPEVLLIPIAMGVVATFLIFWSLSGILLRVIMSFKKVYYNKLNSFVLRQFGSKINTTVASMSVICLMLFVTICVLCSALSINYTLHENIERALPVDVQISTIGRHALPIEELYSREGINLNDYLKDIVTYQTYYIEATDMTELPITAAADQAEEPRSEAEITEEFVHVSNYNQVAQLFGLPQIELADDEYAVLANINFQIMDYRNEALKAGRTIKVLDKTLKPKFDKCIEGTLKLENEGMNIGVIIVSDNFKIDANKESRSDFLLGNIANPENADKVIELIQSVEHHFFSPDGTESARRDEDRELFYYNVESRQALMDNNIGTSALVTFVGLYLGIIFLISSAAILALKELSESSDNRDKFAILRKIGSSNSMLNRALFWQIFIFFLFPLLIAILHSVFGLMFCDIIISSIGGIDITQSLPMISLILLGIYGGYFCITYFCSRNIIREQRK